MIDDSTDETYFLQKLLLTDRQVSKLRKGFANYLSANIKLIKAQLPKAVRSAEFLGRHLEPLIKVDSPQMKNVLKSLIKRVLMPLELTTAASTGDARIHKNYKIFYSRNYKINNFK